MFWKSSRHKAFCELRRQVCTAATEGRLEFVQKAIADGFKPDRAVLDAAVFSRNAELVQAVISGGSYNEAQLKTADRRNDEIAKLRTGANWLNLSSHHPELKAALAIYRTITAASIISLGIEHKRKLATMKAALSNPRC